MDYFMRRIVHVFHIEMIEHVLTANKPTPSHYRTRLLPAQDNKVLANLRAYLSKGVNDLPEEYTNDMKKSDMTEVEFSIVLSSAVKLREVQSSFDQACASFENYQRSMSPGARRGGSTPNAKRSSKSSRSSLSSSAGGNRMVPDDSGGKTSIASLATIGTLRRVSKQLSAHGSQVKEDLVSELERPSHVEDAKKVSERVADGVAADVATDAADDDEEDQQNDMEINEDDDEEDDEEITEKQEVKTKVPTNETKTPKATKESKKEVKKDDEVKEEEDEDEEEEEDLVPTQVKPKRNTSQRTASTPASSPGSKVATAHGVWRLC